MKTKVVAILALSILFLGFVGCGGGSAAQQVGGAGGGGSSGGGSTSGGTSSTPPSIISISPSSAPAGRPDVTLTIMGSGFDNGRTTSIVGWSTASNPNCPISNGGCTWLDTTFIDSDELTAVIPAALLASAVTAKVFVVNYDAMGEPEDLGSPTSNAVTFSVTAPAPAVSPASAVLGPKSTQQFVAMMNGKPADATWAIQEGPAGGTVTASGLYTVPDQGGTFHVIATLVAEPSNSATAEISVTESGFTPTGNMQVARSGHKATLLKNGKVLILGGGDATAELFDPTSGTFSFTGPPVTGRRSASATLLADGRVLIAGGLGLTAGPDGFLPVLETAELFDPATNSFSATGNMQQARWDHVATLLNDGRVLITGGRTGLCFTANAELFDPATNSFSSIGFMLSERDGHTATLLSTGEVLIAGGSNGCAPDAADDPPWDPLFVELYEPNSKTFLAAGNMSTTRIGHAAIRLADGHVLLLGGILSIQNLHDQPPNPSYAELYDPAAQFISPVAGLTISQTGYSATLLGNGLVLVAGGKDSNGLAVSEAQLLNTSTAELTPTGSLATPRVGHTATLLQDGRVLVTGGTDANGGALASAEIYQ
jgi:hypothetical protein